MIEQQVVLTLRVPTALLDRLEAVARRLEGVRRSRSDAARAALESGLNQLECSFGIPASDEPQPPPLAEQVTSLQRRVEQLERALQAQGKPNQGRA